MKLNMNNWWALLLCAIAAYCGIAAGIAHDWNNVFLEAAIFSVGLFGFPGLVEQE